MGKAKIIEKADKRIWEIDFLRGILIIGMVIDHFMFFLGAFGGLYPADAIPAWLANVSNFATNYWNNDVKLVIRFIGVILFFMLTGVSSKFSKSNLKRSLICMGFGILMSLAYMTYSLISGNSFYILFGILTCLGFGMFTYWGLRALYIKIFKDEKNWKWWSLGIGCVFVLVAWIINLCISTDLRFGHIFLSMMGQYDPGNFDASEPLNFQNVVLTILGFHHWGNDCQGILPWVGFTMIGGFIGEHVYAIRKSVFFRKNEEKNVEFNRKAIKNTWVINWLGSKTFIIYILHPIVIILLLLIVFSISCGRLPF